MMMHMQWRRSGAAVRKGRSLVVAGLLAGALGAGLAMPAYAAAGAGAGAQAARVAAPVTLKQVEAALLATTSMRANFKQTASNGQVTTGILSLKRPGRIRFDYGEGAKHLIVADGKLLSFVDYRVNQVSQWPIRSTPLGVLLDPKADLSRIARVLPAEHSPVPGQIAVEAKDPKRPDFGRITFFLKPQSGAPGGLALTGWRVTDAQNFQTVVELSNAKTNIEIANRQFTFKDPRPSRGRPAGKIG